MNIHSIIAFDPVEITFDKVFKTVFKYMVFKSQWIEIGNPNISNSEHPSNKASCIFNINKLFFI